VPTGSEKLVQPSPWSLMLPHARKLCGVTIILLHLEGAWKYDHRNTEKCGGSAHHHRSVCKKV
jgi:hypothetical protein